MLYRIFYGDGSIYHVDEDHPLADAPPLNVQAIVHEDETKECGLYVTYNWDYYFVMPTGEVWGNKGEVDFIESVLFHRPIKCFKARNMRHKPFFDILKSAKAWAKENGKSAGRRRREDGDYWNWEYTNNQGGPAEYGE